MVRGELVRIAPNARLERAVRIHAFVNLYDCKIGDESRIGSFVEAQKHTRIWTRVKVCSHTLCQPRTG